MYDESTLPTVLRKKLPPNLEKIKYGHYTKDDYDYPIHEYLKENDISVDETGSDIINFLRGKSILITGATGFLGKLLVEKLLRCCKDIDTIYIIVRTKKGKDPETRVKEYLNSWVFVKLSEIYPDFGNKVIGVAGDFEQDGLGLSDQSRSLLIEKINIIYHASATVRFDEKLKKAVKINVKGTQEIIKLAKECKKIIVFTHISTAFSNCPHKEIKEEFYPPPVDPQALIDIAEILSSEVVDRITPGLLGDYPNTYTFTKQLAEDLVRTEAVGIPTCIQRPSIVIASVREPVRSWADTIYLGPIGILIAGALGLLHVMLGDPNMKCDLVPADYTVNNCIAASYKTAKERIIDKVQIFNFTCSEVNPFYWGNFISTSEQGHKAGSRNIIMMYFFRFTKYLYWYRFLSFILHVVPGYIGDFIAVRLGKEPRLTKIYSKLNMAMNMLSYFTLNQWDFDSTNTRNLWDSLNDKDKRIFAFDMSTLNWQYYFNTYVVALLELLFSDFLDKLEERRAHQKRVYLAWFTTLSIILALSIYFCINTIFSFIPITIILLILYYIF